MKRYIRTISLLIIIIGIFVYVINKPKDYKQEYSLNDYKIEEEYHKNDKYYSFKLIKDEYVFYFANNNAYSLNRKLISNINEEVNDDTVCLSITIQKKTSETICSNKKEYTSHKLNDKVERNDEILSYEDIKVYDKLYKYFEWNGYGFTDILNKKEYKILKKESYDNLLSYQYDKYIIFADYDQKNEFKQFYLFNTEKKKYEKIKLKDSISFDSYFEGVYKDNIYLFDKNNLIQYKINLKKKTVLKSNNSDGALYYDGEVSSKQLNMFKYNNLLFTNNKLINYTIDNNVLYYSYFKNDIKVKLKEDVQKVLYSKDYKVVYISKGHIYETDLLGNTKELLESMQWEFHYDSQIYIF